MPNKKGGRRGKGKRKDGGHGGKRGSHTAVSEHATGSHTLSARQTRARVLAAGACVARNRGIPLAQLEGLVDWWDGLHPNRRRELLSVSPVRRCAPAPCAALRIGCIHAAGGATAPCPGHMGCPLTLHVCCMLGTGRHPAVQVPAVQLLAGCGSASVRSRYVAVS